MSDKAEKLAGLLGDAFGMKPWQHEASLVYWAMIVKAENPYEITDALNIPLMKELGLGQLTVSFQRALDTSQVPCKPGEHVLQISIATNSMPTENLEAIANRIASTYRPYIEELNVRLGIPPPQQKSPMVNALRDALAHTHDMEFLKELREQGRQTNKPKPESDKPSL